MSPILLVFRQRVTTGEIDELLNSICVYAIFREDQVSLCDFGKKVRSYFEIFCFIYVGKKLLLATKNVLFLSFKLYSFPFRREIVDVHIVNFYGKPNQIKYFTKIMNHLARIFLAQLKRRLSSLASFYFYVSLFFLKSFPFLF